MLLDESELWFELRWLYNLPNASKSEKDAINSYIVIMSVSKDF